MDIEFVSELINKSKAGYKDIINLLNKDDETVLYFLDEYPLQNFVKNRSIKKELLIKLEKLKRKYKKVRIGNVETILDACIILFPKQFFYIVGTKSLMAYGDSFKYTIFDYCLTNHALFYKKDIYSFIRNNNEKRNSLINGTRLIIEFVCFKKNKLYQEIVQIVEDNRNDDVFIERVKNIQKDLRVFTSIQFNELSSCWFL